jgi:hypothetical protein
MDDIDLDAMLDTASKLGVADEDDDSSEHDPSDLPEELEELRQPPIVTLDGVALDSSLDGDAPEVNHDGVSIHASLDGGGRLADDSRTRSSTRKTTTKSMTILTTSMTATRTVRPAMTRIMRKSPRSLQKRRRVPWRGRPPSQPFGGVSLSRRS